MTAQDRAAAYSCGHVDAVREKPPLLCPLCHTGYLRPLPSVGNAREIRKAHRA